MQPCRTRTCYGLPVISEILTVLDPGFSDYCMVRSATEHYQSTHVRILATSQNKYKYDYFFRAAKQEL